MFITIRQIGFAGDFRQSFFDIPFSYGDIVSVKEKAYGRCLTNSVVKSLFGVDDKNVTENQMSEYPRFSDGYNQWKIIDFKANYYFELCILLKNRFGRYAVMSWNNNHNSPFKLLKSCEKEHKTTLDIISKY